MELGKSIKGSICTPIIISVRAPSFSSTAKLVSPSIWNLIKLSLSDLLWLSVWNINNLK